METCNDCKNLTTGKCQACKAKAYPRVEANKVYVPTDPAEANICDGCE